MKKYTADTLKEVENGWYWAKRFEGDTPVAVPVYWKVRALTGDVWLRIDFGYCSEVDYHPADPEKSYSFSDGFALLGPIPTPVEF